MEFQIFEHALVAVAIQTIIGLLTRQWGAGGALASCYFIGREVAQAEYRWIEAFSEGRRANMPWHAVFDPRVWQTPDQLADWLGPVLLTSVITLLMHAAKRKARSLHRSNVDQ